MKYVAFLDILGFKEKLKGLQQDEACRYINAFSTAALSAWNAEKTDKLRGTIVSDSTIIYTVDVTEEAFRQLINVITEICLREFSELSVLLRGAIAKGNFDSLPAIRFPEGTANINSDLIVGQAYVDAYLMEGAVKTAGIVFSDECCADYNNLSLSPELCEEKGSNITFHVYRYLTLDFLNGQENLERFVSLAKESQWLPHYYNALHLALKGERSVKKANELFARIIRILQGAEPSENWRCVDNFIKNTFQPEVANDYQKRFLKFLRMKIQG